MAKPVKITIERLRTLEPLSNLSDERLEELVSLSYVENLPIGVSIFREGEIDNQTIYLLEGDVQLNSSDNKIDKVVSSKQDEARYPIDDSQPRQASAIALGRIEIFRIDNSVLDYMMMWDQMAVSEENLPPADDESAEIEAAEAGQDKPEADQAAKESVETKRKEAEAEPEPQPQDDAAESRVDESAVQQSQDIKGEAADKTEKSAAQTQQPATAPMVAGDEDKSWIRKMRHIMAFKNMPPANIKSLLEKMETILANKGDVIVRQGDEGDFYYVLTEGEAQVTRMVELAELRPGASFGEEALVSDNTRNASVTMKTDGMLMRLSKRDFNALLKEPMLARVAPDEAREIVNKGGIWLDVRHAKEYSYSHLPKAINIPLHEMRIRLDELEKDRHYVCYCTTGRRSSAAAFLLAQRGYKVCVLNGGVQVMAQDMLRQE